MLFEPTDVEISSKPFETTYWKAVKLITPNLNELKHIATFLNIPKNSTYSNTLNEAAYLAKELVNWIDNVIVTLGPSGVLVARKALAQDSFLKYQPTVEVNIRHYPIDVIEDFVNVSGAGDCLASGIIAGTLRGLTEMECLSVGFAAARLALYSRSAVPEEMISKNHPSWNSTASFQTINF